MEFLRPRGSEQIHYWSVSLGQDAIGTPETVKETCLELKRRFARAANVLDEQMAQLKQQAAQIQKMSAQLELTKPAPQTVMSD
jgi:ppGpp synthetase/RelA/SpoT-type nucleotidyltranferase